MTGRILVLRPEPGASETAARARALGLDAVVAPLFEVRSVAWDPPEPDGFDAVLITSANAPRHGGPGLAGFAHLPCYAVGEASAAAARAAGFAAVRVGGQDGAAAVAAMAAAGVGRAFHPCGRDHVELGAAGMEVERRVAYAAEAVPELPGRAAEALAGGAVALLHSPRAASLFSELIERGGLERGPIAAISANAAAAAGPGWRDVGIAPTPDDSALLEVAAKLCQDMEQEAQDREGRMVEYEPAVTGLERRRSPLSWLLLPAIAFLLGLAAMAWLLSSWGSAAYFLGIAPEAPPAVAEPAPVQEPAPVVEPEPEPEPQLPPAQASATPDDGNTQRLVIDPETQRRVAALEQRLGEITSQSSAAVGNAGRAEGLLVAFAARRALDRGIALGYIEHLLRQRFGAGQPQAVGTIITVARQPITLQELQRELRDLGPRLTGAGPNQGWWSALKTEIGGLVTIRRQGTQSTVPSDRLRRALQHVEAGEVNLALVEVLRMPDREQGRAWIDKARRYVAARSALDTIETAALLDPVSRPQPAQRPAQPQQRPQPARPSR